MTSVDIDLEHSLIRVERQLADDDVTCVDVKNVNAVATCRCTRFCAARFGGAQARGDLDDDDPVYAAGRRKPKPFVHVRRAFASGTPYYSRERPSEG